jgi:peptide deformylase
MAVRPILLYPDQRLKTACNPVDDITPDIVELIKDLIDTIDAGPPRTVGIAAPQLGAMCRVAIVDASRNPKFDPGHGLLTLINPTVVAHEGEQIFREGCLSIPDFTANIRRWQQVTVEAQDIMGDFQRYECDGFEAVVMQHEIDHLDGVLFLDRVANVKTDLFTRKVSS